MKKLSLLIILAVLICPRSMAQSLASLDEFYFGDEKEGVIINNEGEAMVATFNFFNLLEVNSLIEVKFEDGSEIGATPDEFSAFIVGDDLWVSLNDGEGKSFFRQEIDGPISKYVKYMASATHSGEVTKATVPKLFILYQRLEEKSIDWSVLLFGFKKKFPALVKGHPNLGKKIENKEKGYKAGQVDKIVKEFNEWYKGENSSYVSNGDLLRKKAGQ